MSGYQSLQTFERHNTLWLSVADLSWIDQALASSIGGRAATWTFNNANPMVGTLVPPSGPRRLPQDWATFAVDLYWANPGTGTGNVGWRLRRGFIEPGDILNNTGPIVDSASSVVVAAPAKDILTVTEMETGITVVPGEFFALAIWRENATSVLTDNMRVLGLMLRKVT